MACCKKIIKLQKHCCFKVTCLCNMCCKRPSPHPYTCVCGYLYVHVYVCVGSFAPLMCWAHMVGRLDGPGTVHYVVIWQRTHHYLRYPFVPFTLLHGWCGTTHVGQLECLFMTVWLQLAHVRVRECVCEVTKRPVCGSVSCQASVCPQSGHMDTETAVSQPGSGCCYLSVTSWTTADATSARTQGEITHTAKQDTKTHVCMTQGRQGHTLTQDLHSYTCTYNMLIYLSVSNTMWALKDNKMFPDNILHQVGACRDGKIHCGAHDTSSWRKKQDDHSAMYQNNDTFVKRLMCWQVFAVVTITFSLETSWNFLEVDMCSPQLCTGWCIHHNG